MGAGAYIKNMQTIYAGVLKPFEGAKPQKKQLMRQYVVNNLHIPHRAPYYKVASPYAHDVYKLLGRSVNRPEPATSLVMSRRESTL